METEEEDNSKPLEPSLDLEDESKLTTPPRTATEMDTQHDLSNTEPQCETESVAELHEPQFDSGYTESEQPIAPPPPVVQTETTVVDENQEQGDLAGEDSPVAELSDLEVGGGDGGDESKSPPRLSPPATVVERSEGEVARAEEESQWIEPPQPLQEVAEKEEEVGEEDKDDATKCNDEDVNLGAEGLAGDDKIESEREVVGDLAEKIETETVNKEIESGMEAEAGVTDATKELTMANKVESMEEVEVAEEMERAKLDGVAKEIEGPNMDDIAEEMVGANMDDVAAEAYTAEEVEEEKVGAKVADLAEETEEEQEEAAQHAEINDIVAETEAATEDIEEAADEGREMDVMEMADVAEGSHGQGDMQLSEMGEEMEAEGIEKVNVAEEMEMAEETEGAEDEVEEVRSAGGKRKRGKNAKTPTRVSSRKKLEEDVCFICFDGGELVLCDRR